MSDYSCKLAVNGTKIYYHHNKRIAKAKIPVDIITVLECEEEKEVKKKADKGKKRSPPRIVEQSVTRSMSPLKSPVKKSSSPPRVLLPPTIGENLTTMSKLERSANTTRRMREISKGIIPVIERQNVVEITEVEPPLETPLRTWAVPLMKSPPRKKVSVGGERARSPPNKPEIAKGGLSKHKSSRPKDYDWLLYYWDTRNRFLPVKREDIVKFELEYGQKYPYEDRQEIMDRLVTMP